ncbi:MAG TPA: cytochrome c biogenesis CcdA family protein [Acidimicrobiales bacterium]|nr:cytochrome c biogenesis CcdA family protein [Acidimicrobiales bacterium]
MFAGLAPSTVSSGALGYAFALGLVGAANPCGLPLLPAYLSVFVDSKDAGRLRPVRALGAAAWVTAGFAATFGVFGVLLGALVGGVEAAVPWVMVPVGLALAVVGIASLAGRRLPLPQPAARLRGRGGPAMFGFGVLYAVASTGCALPVFLAAVGANLAGRGTWTVAGAALAYSFGMGLLLAVLALAATSARRALVRLARPAGRAGQIVGSVLLVASGLYVAFDWAETLSDPLHTPALVGAVNGFQASVSGWMSDHSAWLGVGFAVAVVAVLLAASIGDIRGSSRRPAGELAHD